MSAVNADANGQNSVAVTGKATGENSIGVYGSADVHGLYGEGGANGIFALGKTWCGVAGYSQSTTGGVGVYGENTAGGTGVMGKARPGTPSPALPIARREAMASMAKAPEVSQVSVRHG